MATYKFYKLTNDKMCKAIFSKKSNSDLLERLLFEVTGIIFKVISVTIPELPKNNIHLRGKILDIVANTKDGTIFNIELNNSFADYLCRRNASYLFNLYSNQVRESETYQSMPDIIQINLTNGQKDMPLKAEYTLYDKENKLEYIDNLKIYEINLQKAKEKWYNESSNKSLISLFCCDLEELTNTRGDDLVEKLKEEIQRLNKDVEFVKFLSDEEEERLYTNSLKQEAFEDGIEQGIIVTAKNMLKENIDINTVSKVTGLSVDEINKLI